MPKVNPIPNDYPRLSPYICVEGAADAIAFYKRVFDATERMRLSCADGKVGHAELQIGDALLMLADPFPEMNVRSPKAIGGTPVTLSLYVEDVDAVFAAAMKAGAKSLREPQNQFYGDRSGQFEDPFGHRWSIVSHVEEVAPEEIKRRAAHLPAC